MIKEIKSLNKKFLFTTIFVLIYHIYLSINYNLIYQHDTWLHHWYLARVLLFDFDLIHSEYGIFYYLYVSIYSIFTYPLYFFEIISPRNGLYLTIKLSNIPLIILTSFYLFKFISIFIKKDYLICLSILLFFSFSPIQRSFLMARPENLMILITIIILYLIFKLYKNQKEENKITFTLIILFFFMITQKITGFLYILFIVTLISIFYKKNLKLIKIFMYSLIPSIIYFFLHYKITGIHFLETSDVRMGGEETVGILNTFAPISILYHLNIFEAWINPLRNDQWLSMWNILLIDLFGDYWNYGFINNEIINQNIECKKSIARISIMNSITFFIISFFILLKSLHKKYLLNHLRENYLIEAGTIFLFTGISIFIPAALLRLPIETSSIFKWEYISYFMWPICAANFYFIEKNYKNKILMYLLILIIIIGFIQAAPFRC